MFLQIAWYAHTLPYADVKTHYYHPLVALSFNSALLLLWFLQHSIMARTWCQDFLISIASRKVERLMYLVASFGVFEIVEYFWDPIANVVIFEIPSDSMISMLLSFLFYFGLFGIIWTVVTSIKYDLFGIHEAFTGEPAPSIVECMPTVYRIVRSPLFASSLLCYWCNHKHTLGSVQFCLMMTIYCRIAIKYHEKDSVKADGKEFVKYQQEVGLLVPRGISKGYIE